MDAHPLDNPLWASLTTLHRELALGDRDPLRYPADVAPFLATAGDAPLPAGALAWLLADGEEVLLLGPRPAAPPGYRVGDLGVIHQMLCDGKLPEAPGPAIVPLTEAHRPAVLALTALVYPHYFRPRTTALGRYFGIFDGERLAAMAGERMGMPDFREISAVCTHPDFVGRGLARRLLAFLGNDILARGSTPFLHVSPANTRAVRLYEQNGYRTRLLVPFWSLRREGAEARG
jgi:ribosomal protein S18 acetylase RimI-like enzyme